MSSTSDAQSGAQPDAQVLDALLSAALHEDLAMLQAILDAHPNLANATASNGMRALTEAIYGYSYEAVEFLRARGAEPTIFEAAALGDLGALGAWLQADPVLAHAYSFDGWTALHLAAQYGHVEVVRALLAASADPDAGSRGDSGNTPLGVACDFQGNEEIAAVLLGAGADVNARMQYGVTPLHRAAENADEPMVRLLLAHGADREARDEHGQTPGDAGAGGLASLLEG